MFLVRHRLEYQRKLAEKLKSADRFVSKSVPQVELLEEVDKFEPVKDEVEQEEIIQQVYEYPSKPKKRGRPRR